jgi:hypothetical protein
MDANVDITECGGEVEYRPSLTGTGYVTIRCEGHWFARLDLEDELNSRYPINMPDDFDFLDAGEHWDEDY